MKDDRDARSAADEAAQAAKARLAARAAVLGVPVSKICGFCEGQGHGGNCHACGGKGVR